MTKFYEPNMAANPDDPFARDEKRVLVRKSYWIDMSDRSLILAMTRGVGATLTADQKRAHLRDIKREHLIDDVCIQEIIPPERG